MRNLKRKLLASGLIALLTGCFFGKSKTVDSKSVQSSQPSESIYGIKIMALDEKTPNDLNQFKGKKIVGRIGSFTNNVD